MAIQLMTKNCKRKCQNMSEAEVTGVLQVFPETILCMQQYPPHCTWF